MASLSSINLFDYKWSSQKTLIRKLRDLVVYNSLSSMGPVFQTKGMTSACSAFVERHCSQAAIYIVWLVRFIDINNFFKIDTGIEPNVDNFFTLRFWISLFTSGSVNCSNLKLFGIISG